MGTRVEWGHKADHLGASPVLITLRGGSFLLGNLDWTRDHFAGMRLVAAGGHGFSADDESLISCIPAPERVDRLIRTTKKQSPNCYTFPGVGVAKVVQSEPLTSGSYSPDPSKKKGASDAGPAVIVDGCVLLHLIRTKGITSTDNRDLLNKIGNARRVTITYEDFKNLVLHIDPTWARESDFTAALQRSYLPRLAANTSKSRREELNREHGDPHQWPNLACLMLALFMDARLTSVLTGLTVEIGTNVDAIRSLGRDAARARSVHPHGTLITCSVSSYHEARWLPQGQIEKVRGLHRPGELSLHTPPLVPKALEQDQVQGSAYSRPPKLSRPETGRRNSPPVG